MLFPEAQLSDATTIVNQIQKQLEGKRWAVAASGQPLGARHRFVRPRPPARGRIGRRTAAPGRREAPRGQGGRSQPAGRRRQRFADDRGGAVMGAPGAGSKAAASFGQVLEEVEGAHDAPEGLGRAFEIPGIAMLTPGEARGDEAGAAWDHALGLCRSDAASARRRPRAAAAGAAAQRRRGGDRGRTRSRRRPQRERSSPRPAALHVGKSSRSPARSVVRTRQSAGGDRQYAGRSGRGGLASPPERRRGRR